MQKDKTERTPQWATGRGGIFTTFLFVTEMLKKLVLWLNLRFLLKFWTPPGENYLTIVLLGSKRGFCLSMTLDKKSEELLLHKICFCSFTQENPECRALNSARIKIFAYTRQKNLQSNAQSLALDSAAATWKSRRHKPGGRSGGGQEALMIRMGQGGLQRVCISILICCVKCEYTAGQSGWEVRYCR